MFYNKRTPTKLDGIKASLMKAQITVLGSKGKFAKSSAYINLEIKQKIKQTRTKFAFEFAFAWGAGYMYNKRWRAREKRESKKELDIEALKEILEPWGMNHFWRC